MYYRTEEVARKIGKGHTRIKQYCKILNLPIVGRMYVIDDESLELIKQLSLKYGEKTILVNKQ